MALSQRIKDTGVLQNQRDRDREGRSSRLDLSFVQFVEMQTFSTKWGWCTTLRTSPVSLAAEVRASQWGAADKGLAVGFRSKQGLAFRLSRPALSHVRPSPGSGILPAGAPARLFRTRTTKT